MADCNSPFQLLIYLIKDKVFLLFFYQNFSIIFFDFSILVGGTNFSCSRIDYFPTEEYQPDDQDSSKAIPCEYNAY